MKTTQKRMKIILNESQVKRLLDTITKESVLKESKKPKTFAGLIISEITNPTPKIIPETNDANLFISNF